MKAHVIREVLQHLVFNFLDPHLINRLVSLVHYLLGANVEAEFLEEGVTCRVSPALLPQPMLNLLNDTVGDHFCFSGFIIS